MTVAGDALSFALWVAIEVYFSPYQSGVRSLDADSSNAAFTCARWLGGSR